MERKGETEREPLADVLPPLAALFGIALAWRLFSRMQDGTPLGGFDERTYLRFATAFHSGGIGAIRELLTKYPTDPILKLGPLPLRIFFVAVSSFAISIGGASQESVAAVSTIAGFGTIALAWLLFRRWYSSGIAWIGTLLVIFASLETALSRRSLQDGFFTFWMVAMIYLFERTVTAKNRWDPWLLGVATICALLTKELAAFLFPVFIAAGWNRSWRRAVLPLAVATIGAVLVLVYVAGGVDPLVSTYRAYSFNAMHTDYMNYQHGEWFRYFIDLALLSPVVVPLVIASAMLPNDVDREGHRRALTYVAASFVMFSVLASKSVRFVAFIDVMMRGPVAALIVAAVAGWGIARSSKPARWRMATAGVLLAACIGTEIWQFETVFVSGRVYDPVTANLVKTCGLEP